MANTKDVNKAIIKEQFFRLGQIVDNAKASKNTYQSELAKVDGYSRDYSTEYLEGLKAKVENEYKAQNQKLNDDAQKQIEKLSGALGDLHGSLDLNDPALTNAVGLIKSVGPGLVFDNVLKINAHFASNQPALRILRDAYKSANFVSNGGLDEQIYNIEDAIQGLGRHTQSALIQGNESAFILGVEIGKVAKLEGIDFPQGNPFPTMSGIPSTVDVSAARAAAGLPPKGPEGK